jgi:hypothetical protein
MSSPVTFSRIALGRGIQHHFIRTIDPGSQILVKVNDMVRPETIVSSVWKKSGYRSFDLGEMLGVKPEKVETMLERTIGSRVYQGDILARKKEIAGLREKVFRSPLTGVLVSYESSTSKITLQYLPVEERMVSGVFGKVLDIQPDKHIKIGTKADLIFGAITFGVDREGGLMEIGYPDIPLQSDQLTDKCAGKIIFGGTKVTLDVLYKALSFGARAIISGGIDYHDYLRLRGSRGRLEDIGISVLVTEGIGAAQMYGPTYENLKKSEHRHVFFTSSDGALVIPLPMEGENSLKGDAKSFDYGQIRKFSLIKNDQVVRVISGEQANEYGTVVAINEDKSVNVKINSTEFQLLPTQLEIIDFVNG